uniref:Uncharacterized protein n=1 Tax=Onchocerca volvulus TaxID=6282 RepID=A0A8R1TM20_ONCVO
MVGQKHFDVARCLHINDFNFPTELYFDLWGMVDDYKNGRLEKTEISMKKVATDAELLSDE